MGHGSRMHGREVEYDGERFVGSLEITCTCIDSG